MVQINGKHPRKRNAKLGTTITHSSSQPHSVLAEQTLPPAAVVAPAGAEVGVPRPEPAVGRLLVPSGLGVSPRREMTESEGGGESEAVVDRSLPTGFSIMQMGR